MSPQVMSASWASRTAPASPPRWMRRSLLHRHPSTPQASPLARPVMPPLHSMLQHLLSCSRRPPAQQSQIPPQRSSLVRALNLQGHHHRSTRSQRPPPRRTRGPTRCRWDGPSSCSKQRQPGRPRRPAGDSGHPSEAMYHEEPAGEGMLRACPDDTYVACAH